MTEEPLPGGFVSGVTRVGDTVRRASSGDSSYVRALLGWFERRGWPGAPRFLGTDDQGREVLSFIDGHVCATAPGLVPRHDHGDFGSNTKPNYP